MVLIKAFIKISHPRIQFIFYIFYTLFIELELRLKISALLQSSNLNIKHLAFSPKVSELKIGLCLDFEQKNIFPCFKQAHLGMLTRKLARYLFGGRNLPINELCALFNQWRYLKIFSFIGKEKSMVLHSEIPFQLVRSRARGKLAAAVQ